jgi:hypothetical protein
MMFEIPNNNLVSSSMEVDEIEEEYSVVEEHVPSEIIPSFSGGGFCSSKQTENIQNLDRFLENERNYNKSEPWCKLDKTVRSKKLIEFADTYKENNQLEQEEFEALIVFFKDCLDRKRFQKVKDVIYDKETGLIKEIPALSYTKANKHFTLKNIDAKRVSATKSLAPKKAQGTVRNKKEAV